MVECLHGRLGSRLDDLLRLAALAAAAFWAPAAHTADVDVAMLNVDVAVVFAVDFSSSIDPKIADLLREGHAAALTSAEIIRAISQNYLGCIGVTYFE
ncbi:DUF1194 domain-containing protein, partial [Mesorhizobium sp. M8A.F.Ca.ET.142.01.1.1]|uniref:DUF1194 domain-containing protein n=1 Tax=Mesorhizobium sp. M8A.F.Ca.ET.142.01.1.1 TaxID=2563958 RepID=UPI001678503C